MTNPNKLASQPASQPAPQKRSAATSRLFIYIYVLIYKHKRVNAWRGMRKNI